MRETTAGWQHVAWLDASQAAPGHQKRRHCLVGPQTIMWDGIDTEGAALAESPDVFTGGITPFHRALPQVISGEPVPPPYYTIFFRYRAADSDSAEILDEANVKLYVPQVVKVEMTDAAYEEFTKPILYPSTYHPDLLGASDVIGCETNITLYMGCSGTTKEQLCTQIAHRCQETYEGVNIRFSTETVSESVKVLEIMCANSRNSRLFGQVATVSDSSFRNEKPKGKAYVHMDVIREATSSEKFQYDNNIMKTKLRQKCEIPMLFPFSDQELMNAVAATTEHETGHLLGLVSHDYLGGTKGMHNANILVNGWIMNTGSLTPMVYRLGSRSNRNRSWKTENLMYLRFVLPKGE